MSLKILHELQLAGENAIVTIRAFFPYGGLLVSNLHHFQHGVHTMRFDGTLKSWDDGGRFGFIKPTNDGEDIFVHISAFPNDGVRPVVGEPLSFEVELSAEGKIRSYNIQRPGRQPRVTAGRKTAAARPARSLAGTILIVSAALAIAVYVFKENRGPVAAGSTSVSTPVRSIDKASLIDLPARRCDSRTHCSQMTSCVEAKYFLKNCPVADMDGDNDGIPCERQWCTGRSVGSIYNEG
jgi:cold shock CspA family protein